MGNACIGLLNHKFFILYLFYIIYFCAQVAGPFVKLMVLGSDTPDGKPLTMLLLLARNPNEFIAYALSCALILGVGFMFIYQIVILVMNKTTMEVSLDPRHSPFKHDSISKNI